MPVSRKSQMAILKTFRAPGRTAAQPQAVHRISTRGLAKVNFLSIAQNGRRMCA
jgi:hypothetical protein